MSALDELESLLAAAKAIPLKFEVRVESADLKRAVDAVVGEVGRTSEVEELDSYLSRLRRLPLTSQVRVDPDRAQALIDRIRAAEGSSV